MGGIGVDTIEVQRGDLSNKTAIVESGEIDDDGVENHVDGNEKVRLLPPSEGLISRKGDKPRRKVQWNDRNGHSLVEVLEFQPSDQSDSDDEDHDSCICIVM